MSDDRQIIIDMGNKAQRDVYSAMMRIFENSVDTIEHQWRIALVVQIARGGAKATLDAFEAAYISGGGGDLSKHMSPAERLATFIISMHATGMVDSQKMPLLMADLTPRIERLLAEVHL